jgi:hypothetical protein
MIFLNSARSIIPKNETKKYTKHSYEKLIKKKKQPIILILIHLFRVERVTRYSLKVKSGEIQPPIPQWQQKDNNKKKGQLSKWTVIYKNNAAPYQRIFKPRNTRIGARVEQELMRLKKKQNNS